MRFLLCALAVFAACSDSSTTNPAGGSSGVPNQNNTSSSGASGSSGSTKKDAGGATDDDDDDVADKDAGPQPPLGPANVRLMAANISTGSQSYDNGEGIRIFQGLKPDVVMIQEFNYGTKSETDIRKFVTDTFGADFQYFRETGGIPNGVISKYAITDSGHFASGAPDRGFAWAKITVPGTHALYAFSVHLRTSSSTVRDGEAKILTDKIKEMVPTGDFIAVGGDFNTDSRNENCLKTINAVVDAENSHATDGTNENTNANRGKPYDWMLASPNLVAHQVPTVIGENSFANGLVFDSRVYEPLADVAPVKKSDSAAPEMQHMAIVKDFHLE
jgi:endonuclease/exonuclease/phosphatase family metal-dependent hydrolase